MVDFQSRETRRGTSTDDPDEPEAGSESADATDEPRTDDGREGLGFAVVTVGTGLTVEDDGAGDAAVEALAGAGDVVTREVIDASYDGVQSTVSAVVDRRDVDCLLTVGGVGISPTDVTVGALEALFDKRLPGVGELIRQRTVEERGTAAVRSRATGGIVERVPVFCLPDDPTLAGWATSELVAPEAESLVALATGEDA